MSSPLPINDLIKEILFLFPDAEVAEDNDGQMIVYTGVDVANNPIKESN